MAERIPNRRIVLKRNPYYPGGRPANVDQVVVTIGESGEACLLAVEQDRLDHCSTVYVLPSGDVSPARRAVRHQPARRAILRRPAARPYYLAFNHDRPAFKGPGQIALKKAINYAIDRPELARAFGYLQTRRTDQMLPPILGRDESIYPLKGADPATARKWYARAKFQPRTLVLYARSTSYGVKIAQTLTYNLKQIGIDLEVKYYDFDGGLRKAGTRGEPFDIFFNGWFLDYRRPRRLPLRQS